MTAITVILGLVLVAAALWWHDAGPEPSPLVAWWLLITSIAIVAILLRWAYIGNLSRALWIEP
jgi:hypothetical protein